ncbi:YigZ family protein [Candidatus Chloroploca sp. M-50]|uniref:YigZ family protein n=1 Tax=Candidatus Chloroploca mongolica TaxID=2528176 RepID=A0ABS4DEX8_9CHLR|nr:YigZ family protein [Candidatus Chloroploca mongolica]MBP1467982.1 YigZ family protein [Candidatus Chloroploca mongolica]
MSLEARYPIPAARATTELMVSNSRFISRAGYTPDVDAAKAFIAAIRAAEPDATHHCFAYLVGYGASVTAGMSDDGEPSGTAGRPMLAVLRGADLGDVTVVVTRYFGGTLLGTGGLVRAYSDAVRAVLAELPRGEHVVLQRLRIEIDYSLYATVRRILENAQALIDDEAFGATVVIIARLPVTDVDRISAQLAESTAGQVRLRLT